MQSRTSGMENHPDHHANDHGGHHRHDGVRPSAAAKYYCPMCEGVESDKPGECPKCGMALERNPAYDYIRADATKNAVVFRNCSDCILSGCSIEGVRKAEAGLILEHCNRFNVTGCSILDCDKAGVLARNLTNSRISDCIIRDDRKEQKTQSIVVEGGKGNQIIDNLTNE